jgi:hypothetical protein
VSNDYPTDILAKNGYMCLDVDPIQAPVRDVGEIGRTITAFARNANGVLMVLPGATAGRCPLDRR